MSEAKGIITVGMHFNADQSGAGLCGGNLEPAGKYLVLLPGRRNIKLKAKAADFLAAGECKLEKEFDLADITLMEESWDGQAQSQPNLSYDNSWEKYMNYTEEQLAKEFKSYTWVDEWEGSDWAPRRTVYTIYYDGNMNPPVTEDEYGKALDMTKLDDSNHYVFWIDRDEEYINGEWKQIEQDDNSSVFTMYFRMNYVVRGIDENTRAKDIQELLQSIEENSEVWIGDEYYDAAFILGIVSAFRKNDKDIRLEADIGSIGYNENEDEFFNLYEPQLLYGIDSREVLRIWKESDDPSSEIFNAKFAEYCANKAVNPKAYAWVYWETAE